MKILVIRGGGVGDFVLTLPLLKSLRELQAGARVHLVGHTSIAEVAAGQGYFDSMSRLSSPVMARLFSTEPARDPAVREFLSGFDLSVSFLNDGEGILEKNLSEFIPERIYVTPPNGSIHASQHFLSFVQKASKSDTACVPEITPSVENLCRARKWIKSNRIEPDFPCVAIHPGSGGRNKNWSPENFGAVIDELGRQRVETLLIEGEADTETIASVLKSCSQRPAIARNLQLTVLSAVLDCCEAYLGNDSGISHLAAALGLPVTVLFGPTSPGVWRPLGPRVEVVTFDQARPEELAQSITDDLDTS